MTNIILALFAAVLAAIAAGLVLYYGPDLDAAEKAATSIQDTYAENVDQLEELTR